MYINQIKSDYSISNKGLLSSLKKTMPSYKKRGAKQVNNNNSKRPIKLNFSYEKIQEIAKKISDTILKILDTF